MTSWRRCGIDTTKVSCQLRPGSEHFPLPVDVVQQLLWISFSCRLPVVDDDGPDVFNGVAVTALTGPLQEVQVVLTCKPFLDTSSSVHRAPVMHEIYVARREREVYFP